MRVLGILLIFLISTQFTAELCHANTKQVQCAEALEVSRMPFPVVDTTYRLPTSPNLSPVSSLPAISQLKTASVQYEIEGDLSIEQMIDKLNRILLRALEGKPSLIIFPELIGFDLVKSQSQESEAMQLARIADAETEKIVEWFKKAAITHKVSILGGSHPRRHGGEIRNTAYLFLADGTVVQQDKLFMTPDEISYGWQGGDRIVSFLAPWGLSVILICYDSEFPIVSQALSQIYPEFIFIPSMTGTNQGLNRVRWSAQARAVEHFAFVATVGTVHKNGEAGGHVGQSAMIMPQQAPLPAGLQSGTLNGSNFIQEFIFDVEELRRLRTNPSMIYPSRDQRTFNKVLRVDFATQDSTAP